MKQSIFNSLLQVKDKLITSIEKQDNFMRDVALATKDDVVYDSEEYLAKEFDYTITTTSDVAYSFGKTAGESAVSISAAVGDVATAYTTNVDLANTFLDDAIELVNTDPTIPSITVNLSDIVNEASMGENINVLVTNINEKFLNSSTVLTSEVLSYADNANNVLSSDYNTIKQQLLDASVDGRISNFAWANILKNVLQNADSQVETNQSIVLDESSPFSIQTFLNTVFSVIGTIFSVVLQTLMYAIRGLFAIVAAVFSVIANIFSKLGSDRVSPGGNFENTYIKGAVCANASSTLSNSLLDNKKGLVGPNLNNIINAGNVALIQSGCIDYYVWKQDPSNSEAVDLNINAYANPTYHFDRFTTCLAEFFEAYKEHLFLGGEVPTYIDVDDTHPINFWPCIRFFNEFLVQNSAKYLNAESEHSIFLSANEVIRTQTDEDYATWAMWGSLLAHAYLMCFSKNELGDTNSFYCTPDSTNPNNWNHIGYTYNVYTTDSRFSGAHFNNLIGAAISTFFFALQKTQAIRSFDFGTYSSSDLSTMCGITRGILQDIISLNNLKINFADLAVGVNILDQQLSPDQRIVNQGTWSLCPLIIDNVNVVQSTVLGASKLLVNVLVDGSDSLYPRLFVVDSLPSKGCFTVPSFSTEQVVEVMLLVATVAIAAVVVKNKLTATLKARRQIKQTKRAEDLNKLRKAYNDDPDNLEAKQAYEKQLKSYNRKAKFFGWPAYDAANGWMDASSDGAAAISAGASSLLQTSYDTYTQSKEVTEEVEDGTQSIINLIKS